MAGASQDGLERREIHFAGRVQGVGFRFTARGFAERYGLVGYVENLPDGRVRLVVEGDPANCDRMLTSLAQEMERYIQSTDVRVVPATGEFAQFEIRR